MAIDPVKLANLLDLSLSGQPAVCAYWKVVWDQTDDLQTRYYSDSIYNEMSPFQAVGVEMEARLIFGNQADTVAKSTEFELNPDLKTENITLKFDDIDKTITGKFQQFNSGVRCELLFYYPDVDLTVSVWWGQLTAPKIYGWKSLECVATNGFRSREQLIPRRTRPVECTSNFGGLATAEAIETMLCPYDKHLGGSVGNLDPTTGQPFLSCPRLTEQDCIKRLGADNRGRAKYFGGFIVDADAVAMPNSLQHNYIAVSEGNASRLTEPIRVIAGFKHVRDLQLLLWERGTPPGYEHGWVYGVWEVGEGPVNAIRNLKINDYNPSQGAPTGGAHWTWRNGSRGQTNTGYARNSASNFSGTAVVFSDYGWVDTANVDAQSMTAECDVDGYNQVVSLDSGGGFNERGWSENRVWWILELYTNQRWGLSYPLSRFENSSWNDTSEWTVTFVNFLVTYPDGEQQAFPHQRSTFNAILEGRAAAEQIEDICRSGALSIPYQHEGTFAISPYRVATTDELTNARVFTDAGESRNIVWDGGQPSLLLEQTPDDKLVNEVEVTFEDAANGDAARPVTVDSPDQKLLAGRELGDDNLKAVPKKFSAFGVRTLAEAVKLAYRFLRFGEFDTGGTHNNLKATFMVPFEQCLGIKKLDIIKIESDLLDGFLSPEGDTFQYFRVLKINKIGNGRSKFTAQAYNHTAYTAFETDIVVHSCPAGQHYDYATNACVSDGPGSCAEGYHWDASVNACVPDNPDPEPPPCGLTIDSIEYDAVNGNLRVTVPPC